MPRAVQDQVVSALARDVVAAIAPEELPLFLPVSEDYFKDPKKALKRQTSKDEALGFGLAEAATFITPIVLAILTDVLKYLGEHVLQTLKDESSALASDEVKQLFQKFRSGSSEHEKTSKLPTPEQVAQVRRLTFEKARELQLPIAKANLLADSVAGSLAVAS